MPRPPPKQLSGAPERLISRRSAPELRRHARPRLDPAHFLFHLLPFVQSGRTFHRHAIINNNSSNDHNDKRDGFIVSHASVQQQLQPPPDFSHLGYYYLCSERRNQRPHENPHATHHHHHHSGGLAKQRGERHRGISISESRTGLLGQSQKRRGSG